MNMKKILITLLVIGAFTACDQRYEELNTEKKNPADVPGETLFSYGMKEMFDMMVNTNVNENVFRLYAQYWSQTTYPDESAYNQVTRQIPDNVWQNGYRNALKNMVDGRQKLADNPDPLLSDAQNANKLAVIDINIAYTYAILDEVFGDIVFDEALDPDNLTPKYDDGKTTYDNVITMIDDALSRMDPSEPSISSGQDAVYRGNTAQWMMFANSLKLRMALMYFDDNPTKATTMINEAYADGLIMDPADNASIEYQDGAPGTNPLYEDLVLSGRKDFVVSNTLVDKLNDLGDTRIFAYATDPISFPYHVDANNTKKDSTVTDGKGRFIIWKNGTVEYMATPFTILAADSLNGPSLFEGAVYGTANGYAGVSHIGDRMFEPNLKGTLISSTEVMFLLSEAAARGVAMGGMTAEDYYNAGIISSFADWGRPASEATAYLANTDVAYTTADGGSGNWKQIIGTQAWLALYNRGYAGWTTWRRLDFAGFNPPPDMTLADIPTRLLYPVREATLNGANMAAAAAKIGGDSKTTKLWWDKN